MKTMSPRYQLRTGGPSGLSLDVIDHEMGSQVRTSQNLSGGESFMVSLALALGLSRMGGRNLRVDTLFLDEGFGTLDEDTLNKALYALETLQKSSGKLIGIITGLVVVIRIAEIFIDPLLGNIIDNTKTKRRSS